MKKHLRIMSFLLAIIVMANFTLPSAAAIATYSKTQSAITTMKAMSEAFMPKLEFEPELLTIGGVFEVDWIIAEPDADLQNEREKPAAILKEHIMPARLSLSESPESLIVASSDSAGVLTYTINGSNVTITDCLTSATGAQVQAAFAELEASGYSITAIGASAFQNCASLTEINLPQTLASIGIRAFWGTELTSVTIPVSLTTASTVSSTGPFGNISTLTTVTFADGTIAIPANVLAGTGSVTSINLPDTVTSIGNNAFERTGITSIILPPALVSMGQNAFQDTPLASITLPQTLASIGIRAFWGTELTSVTLPASLSTASVVSSTGPFGNISTLTSVTFAEGGTTIPADILRGTSSVTSVIIPDTVTSIGNGAFQGSGITSITLPPALVSIGQNAFQDTPLASITLPQTLASIGIRAFWGTELTSVTIPVSLTTASVVGSAGPFGNISTLTTATFAEGTTAIPADILRGASSVTSVIIPDTVTSIGNGAFQGSGITSITLPPALVSIGNSAFENSSLTNNIDLPYTLTSIGIRAFWGTGLVSVTIPVSLTTVSVVGATGPFGNISTLTTATFAEGTTAIPTYVLAGVSNSINVIMPNTVTSIGNGAFQNSGITTITLPPALVSIGNSAFRNCTNLTEIILPNTVTTIHASAFWNTGLTSVTLPASLTRIDETVGVGPFGNISTLTTVTFAEGMTSIPSNALRGVTSLTNEIIIPNTVTSIGRNAFANLTGPSHIEIPSSVRNIEAFAFSNSGFSSIIIQPGTIEIGTRAFNQVTALEIIELPATVTTIGQLAFAGCSSLVAAVVPPSVTSFVGLYSNVFNNAAPGFTIFGVTGSPVEAYAHSRNIPFETLADNITLFADSSVNSRTFRINGIAPASSDVRIFEDGVLIATLQSLRNGIFNGEITLSDRTGSRTLVAEAINRDGFRISDSARVTFDESAPTLIEFNMTHNRQRVNLQSEIRTPVIIRPNLPITFEVKIENSDGIGVLYVCSERDGETKAMQARYDSRRDVWIASGFFDPDNKGEDGYIVGTLSVRYGNTFAPAFLDMDFSQLQEAYNLLPPEFRNAERTIIENSPTRVEAERTLRLTDTENEDEDADNDIFITYSTTLQTLGGMSEASLISSGFTLTAPGQYRLIDIRISGNNVTATHTTYNYQGGWGSNWGGGSSSGGGTYVGFEQILATTIGDLLTINGYFGPFGLSTEVAMALRLAQLLLEGVPLEEAIIIVLVETLFDLLMGELLGEIFGEILGEVLSWLAAFIIDPAGYVYEAVPSNRIPGATATVYFKQNPEDDPLKWNAAEFSQMNPLITDFEGRYAWDVPEGWWQVKIEKDGYETAFSEWMPVPPPQLNVNIGIINKAAPTVETINGYPKGVEIVFGKYMDITTLTTANIKVTQNDVPVPGEIEFINDEFSIDPTTEYATYIEGTFASIIRFVPENEINGELNITISTDVKSYAGTNIAAEFSQLFTVKPEPESITAADIAIEYGKDGVILVILEPAGAVAGMTLTAVSDNPFIVSAAESAIIDESGKAIVEITGELPGTAIITLMLDGTTLQVQVEVSVGMLKLNDDDDDDDDDDCGEDCDCEDCKKDDDDDDCGEDCDCEDCKDDDDKCLEDCDCEDCKDDDDDKCLEDCDCEDCKDDDEDKCPEDCDCEDCAPVVAVCAPCTRANCGRCTVANCTAPGHVACPGHSSGSNSGGGGGGGGSSTTTETPTVQPVTAITTPVNVARAITALGISSDIPAAMIRFTVTGRQNISIGEEYAGQNAILARFNTETNEIEFVSAATIGANGSASLNITAAGDFLVLTFKTGDITGTGEVQTTDALALLRHVAGIAPLNSIQLFVANGKQGDTGTVDALNILRYVAGIIDKI